MKNQELDYLAPFTEWVTSFLPKPKGEENDVPPKKWIHIDRNYFQNRMEIVGLAVAKKLNQLFEKGQTK